MTKKSKTLPKESVAQSIPAAVAEVEIPKVNIKESKKQTPEDKWEIRDRVYFLKGSDNPVAYIMKTSNIYHFDEELGYEREILLTSNQRTLFVDEMQGVKRPESVVFRDGTLSVPRNKVNMQKLLSIYHPGKDSTYYEYNPVKKATNEIDFIEMELEAMNAVNALDIDMAEAVLRAEMGSAVSKMSSKEIRRDLLVLAKSKPNLIMGLIADENLYLRNLGIKANEMGVIRLSKDNRTFTYATSGQKLMTVPFDEHPYSALAAWFKTDEGMDVLTAIEKKIK